MKDSKSDFVVNMLNDGIKTDTIRDKKQIARIFINEGIPVFEKVIEFQTLYGGILYKIGSRFYKGYKMNLFCFADSEQEYKFIHYKKIDGKYYFSCLDYHYAGDFGPCIDEEGKIYHYGMGQVLIWADNIEEALEDEAVKHYFVSKQDKWLTRGVSEEEFNRFKESTNLKKLVRRAFSDKYFEWFCNEEKTVFIRHNLAAKFTEQVGNVYCKDEKSLRDLYGCDVGYSIYPYKDY